MTSAAGSLGKAAITSSFYCPPPLVDLHPISGVIRARYVIPPLQLASTVSDNRSPCHRTICSNLSSTSEMNVVPRPTPSSSVTSSNSCSPC